MDLLTAANAEIVGPSAGAGVGTVGGGGDVNGDGLADVAIGAPFAPGDGRAGNGAVDVVRGGTSVADIDLSAPGARATRFVPGVGGLLGSRLAGLGDVNGDGVDDLGAGALAPGVVAGP